MGVVFLRMGVLCACFKDIRKSVVALFYGNNYSGVLLPALRQKIVMQTNRSGGFVVLFVAAACLFLLGVDFFSDFFRFDYVVGVVGVCSDKKERGDNTSGGWFGWYVYIVNLNACLWLWMRSIFRPV